MSNNGTFSGLPTPDNSYTGNTPIVQNNTVVATNQREQPQLQGTGGQPPLPVQQAPQPVFNQIHHQPPQPQPQAQPQPQPQHYPQGQPLNVAMPGRGVAAPSLDAFNVIANEATGFGRGYRPPGIPAQIWNVGFHGQPPAPHIPQRWVAYGQHLPAPNYYGGYPGPQAGAPYYGQMHAQAAPQMHPTGVPQLPVNAAPQVYAPAQVPRLHQQALQNAAPPPPAPGHVPQIPQAIDPRMLFLNQEVPQVPPAYLPPPVPFAGSQYDQQQYQQTVPMVPPAGPAEGSFIGGGSKRKAADDADMPQQKQKRHRPQGDSNFQLVQPGVDGKPRWKCLKLACAHVNPMLEVSVHKHVTATKSHQQDSAVPQAEYVCPSCNHSFKRKDALSRHRPTGQCVKNRQKLQLEGTQANVQVAGTSTIAAVPSSSGSAASSETQQLPLLPVATPAIVQAAGSSTSKAAAPIVMHQQQQFTFRVQRPGPSSVIQHSGVQATPTGGTSMVLRTSYAPQEVLSFPVPSNVQNKGKAIQQQPAATPPLYATEADFSTTDTPLPCAEPSSSNGSPFVAGEFSLSIFKQAAKPSIPTPSEGGDDSSGDLFSAPPSPGASRVTPEPLAVPSASNSPPTTQVDFLFAALNETAAEPTPSLSEDVEDSFVDLFSAPPSPTSSEVTPAPQPVELPSSNVIEYDFLLEALNETSAELTPSLSEDEDSSSSEDEDSLSEDEDSLSEDEDSSSSEDEDSL